MTDNAAHQTLDLVERSFPIIDTVAGTAERVLVQAGPLELQQFIGSTLINMKSVRTNLTEVLLAQGYQDLSGQIIRNVMTLVDELEVALGNLIRLGSVRGASDQTATDVCAHKALSKNVQGFGPAVPGINHGNSASDQRDVDDVLSGLGM